MARSVNKLILVGFVEQEPVLERAGGERVARFSVSTSRLIRRDHVVEEQTEVHRITAGGRFADMAEEYIRKEDRLYIVGRVHYDTVERDGVVTPITEVVVRDLVMLGGRSGGRRRAEDVRTVEGRQADGAEARVATINEWAESEGWGIFECGDRWELQRIDDAKVFETDQEVFYHVVNAALKERGAMHHEALAFLMEHERAEYEAVWEGWADRRAANKSAEVR